MKKTMRNLWTSVAMSGLGVLAFGCGSECDKFYSTYSDCGFGEPSDSDLDSCNSAIDASSNCEAAYQRLNICIDELDDACGYPGSCGADLELAFYACDYGE